MNDRIKVLRDVSESFYREQIMDGMSKIEEMIGVIFNLFGEDESIMRFMDALESKDYVLAADIIEYDMIGRVGESS